MESKKKEENQASEREKTKKNSIKQEEKSVYYEHFLVYIKGIWGYEQAKGHPERIREVRRTQNRSEASRNHQNRPKIMKIHEIRSERSPRDKSGAFGFETVFWPLGNVGRPEGVSKGSRGAPGGVYARMGIVGLVCHVYASGRSMYICRARIIF